MSTNLRSRILHLQTQLKDQTLSLSLMTSRRVNFPKTKQQFLLTNRSKNMIILIVLIKYLRSLLRNLPKSLRRIPQMIILSKSIKSRIANWRRMKQ